MIFIYLFIYFLIFFKFNLIFLNYYNRNLQQILILVIIIFSQIMLITI